MMIIMWTDLASSRVDAFPMPALAPVTMATFPLRSGMSAAENEDPKKDMLSRIFLNCQTERREKKKKKKKNNKMG